MAESRAQGFRADLTALGVGSYSPAEASRLLKVPARTIRRWLGGYSYRSNDGRQELPPLWTPLLVSEEGDFELGFKDLIELRFVKAFLEAGLVLHTVRRCLAYTRDYLEADYPFSTQQFRTDGKTIFLESARKSGDAELLDLKKRQYALPKIIERSFKDLDIEAGEVARWRPHRGKASIVIDPNRAFGQPIAAEQGVPTVALAQALQAEGSVDRVSRLYEVPRAIVKDACAFEESLGAA